MTSPELPVPREQSDSVQPDLGDEREISPQETASLMEEEMGRLVGLTKDWLERLRGHSLNLKEKLEELSSSRQEKAGIMQKIREVALLFDSATEEVSDEPPRTRKELEQLLQVQTDNLAGIDQSIRVISREAELARAVSGYLAAQKELFEQLESQWGQLSRGELVERTPIKQAIFEILQGETGLLTIKELTVFLQERGFTSQLISTTVKELITSKGFEGDVVIGWWSGAPAESGKNRPKIGSYGVKSRELATPEGACFFPDVTKGEFGELVRTIIREVLRNAEEALTSREILERLGQYDERFANYKGSISSTFLGPMIYHGELEAVRNPYYSKRVRYRLTK